MPDKLSLSSSLLRCQGSLFWFWVGSLWNFDKIFNSLKNCFESFTRQISLHVELDNISLVAICSSCKFYKCCEQETAKGTVELIFYRWKINWGIACYWCILAVCYVVITAPTDMLIFHEFLMKIFSCVNVFFSTT